MHRHGGLRGLQRARTTRFVTATALAAVATLLGASWAQASTGGVTPSASTSPNWSGYVATSPDSSTVSFTNVTGTWTVPAATCASKVTGAVSTIWVGLGGYGGGPRTEQAGTDTSCSSRGEPSYRAWFELVPYPAYTIPNKVAAGDMITGAVKILKQGFGVVQLQIHDRTRGWTVTKNLSSSEPDTSSAEWIVSGAATCARLGDCTQASLANFGQAGMTEIAAVGNSRSGNLTNPAWKIVPLQLVPATMKIPTENPDGPSTRSRAVSPAGANPGPVAKDGGAFKVTWVAVATSGV